MMLLISKHVQKTTLKTGYTADASHFIFKEKKNNLKKKKNVFFGGHVRFFFHSCLFFIP